MARATGHLVLFVRSACAALAALLDSGLGKGIPGYITWCRAESPSAKAFRGR